MIIWPGEPYPLGASWDGAGVNFALFSENAQYVELCLFDTTDKETARIKMTEKTDQVFHCYLPDARPGQLYGYRVYGEYNPGEGNRFNPHKLLIDPYAKSITSNFEWNDALFGYTIGHPDQDISFDSRDSAPFISKSVVIDSSFSWAHDTHPHIPWNKSFIYEMHVKGMTKLHPEIPPEYRGTYAGIASEIMVEHLLSLGVTAVELMPVHQFINERMLIDNKLSNYWGYNTIGYFSPHSEYCSAGDHGQQVTEFKTMVHTLHREGIEVILDVVYNHTAEGNYLGPTLCFRGIDNTSYYRLADDKRYYIDYTGCGNSPNMNSPRVLQLIMDSLRYWITEMHVDGFRFDLAATLARELADVDRLASFFDIIHQDPVISQVKLIAEPWDLGPGGYMVGNFPILWAEWNGKYRDTVRRFWKGDPHQAGDLTYRLTGSSDLYEKGGRKPHASINYITVHDGFTLNDLVSYDKKHNEENKEENRDGADENCSWNCGVEGPTGSIKVNELRSRQMRNYISTLFISQGVPLLLHGDETGHTKRGNNNTYCQDNELSWINWMLDEKRTNLLAFTRRAIGIWREHPVLRRRNFTKIRSPGDTSTGDVSWWHPEGGPVNGGDWEKKDIRSFAMLLAGDLIDEVDKKGKPVIDDTIVVLFNADDISVEFVLPPPFDRCTWELLLDSRYATGLPPAGTRHDTRNYKLTDYCTAFLSVGRDMQDRKFREKR